MKIGELAGKAGVDVQTVRFYEKEGLLEAPARTPSGYRAYGPAHLEQLQFVRHCRSLDMSLPDIRKLVALSKDKGVSCEDVDGTVRAHLERVRAKRVALEALEARLTSLTHQCDAGHRVADCGVLEELIHAGRGEACACHEEHGPGKTAKM
jgi:DNA-binding transcriptional MerR regulator